ncbi:MAG: T9SS type A sorting domain-containing protein, partial [Bacteroidales bacterium]|nr:T9SS type A sorting domain-containing protein [Bacteroidales bacterium]
EFIGLYDQEATGYAMIDNISFGVQQTDVSFGREYDGAIQFIVFNEPTPGRSNNENAVEEMEAALLNVFPIPASEMISLDGAESLIGEQFEIIDRLGTTRMNIRMDATKIQLSIANLEPGIYYLVCTKKELIRKLIIK